MLCVLLGEGTVFRGSFLEHDASIRFDDDEEEQCQPEPVTLKSAIECLEKLRHFSIQEGNEDSPRQPLNLWADYLNNLTLRRSKQVTLDEFLAK